jgi:branched-chain amino acid transport system substrate-binding protein
LAIPDKIQTIKIFGDEMRFYVVLDFLRFIIEQLLNLVLNLIANIINVPQSIKFYKSIVFLIALLLIMTLSFWNHIFSITPIICQLNTNFESHISEGEKDLIANTPNEKDREQKIYENNKEVDSNNSYILAVAVPGDAREQAARAMLVGVADAQTKFNQAQQDPTTPKKPSNPKLLKIVVVDDRDNKDVAKEVACQIATNPKWKNILGVIGHHSSNASQAALKIYEQAGITMITPSSTSTNLKQDPNNKSFFRGTVSNQALGRRLADKILTLGGRVRVFYEQNNEYSEDLKNQFKNFLGTSPNLVEAEIDILPRQFRLSDVPPLSNDVKAAVFFSAGGKDGTTDRTISLIKKLKTENPTISLFGGDSLYEAETLSKGNTDIEGLKLVFPWFRVNLDGKMSSDYAREAQKTWGDINWVTASSYDATQVFLAAISKVEETSGSIDRKSVLESIPNVKLDKQYTSGEKIEFIDGELKEREPVFVEVVRKKDKKGQCKHEVCLKRTE